MNNEDNTSGGNRPFKKNYNKKPYNKNYQPKYGQAKQKDDLSEVIKRRNARLAEFFKLIGLYVRIIGDENSPAMILNDRFVLNAYVHNFELRFTDNPVKGNIIYTVKLSENPNFDKNKVISCIEDYEKRPVFRIGLRDTNLYLSGYNFLNREEKLGRYPVFSAYAPKIYFTKDKADEVCKELYQDGYNLESF